MSGWSYNRVGENGRLYTYYGIRQEWTYTERRTQHYIKVISAAGQQNGVQYYLISIDGKIQGKPISAARLHYILNQKGAVEVNAGILLPMPMQIEEVEEYFKHNLGPNCPECGGTGIDRGKICWCVNRFEYEIKSFNAERRLEYLMHKGG